MKYLIEAYFKEPIVVDNEKQPYTFVVKRRQHEYKTYYFNRFTVEIALIAVKRRKDFYNIKVCEVCDIV